MLAVIAAFVCLFTSCISRTAETGSAPDEKAFFSPDSSYHTGAWWWWLQCETNREAITRDMEEMKAKKIQRLILADFGTGGNQPRLSNYAYLELASPEWNAMVAHAVSECKRLGLDLGICIGTSGSAAPWVTPEEGQQKLAFAEIHAEGPGQLNRQLPFPSNLRMGEDGQPLFYRDISIVAMPDRDIVAAD
ncbi:MAG: hypothetical protein LBT83_08235, partial [Tannerella sp.]|nr:hypothetical protein [Tannerella sp.]